ncbi:gamma-glutamylcyclotransferase family protein [Pseudoalteromonas sp. T1lg48]|uniref:gamma-glutamylcyclotransferase family protein n=1 Tax=Pseudoalteromonas sp. T1lg48 TaxID=2077100 RepID=UPI000CF6CBD7|nr:gamma-glutamylcyclotransferase family protein [Pseudoalteromonas sp. T1lg48]
MTQYYFAFGSNMSAQRLGERLPEAERVGVAHLRDYRLGFDMLSLDGSGKCTIHRESGASVYGVLWLLDAEQQESLHRIEGPRYDVEYIEVTLVEQQQQIRAYCYIANTLDRVALPFDWYVQHVYRGAQEASLPQHYIAEIARQASIEDLNRERHLREMQIHADQADKGNN